MNESKRKLIVAIVAIGCIALLFAIAVGTIRKVSGKRISTATTGLAE